MSNIGDWDVIAGNNNDPAPNGFPEGMFPSQVNDSNREVMAAIKRFYLQVTDPLNPVPIGVAYANLSNFAKTLMHSVNPAMPDAVPNEDDNGDYYLNRANHFGTINGLVISPQPNDNIGPNAGLGLNAATLQGLTADQISSLPQSITAPAWMMNWGNSLTDLMVGVGTTLIAPGTYYYNNVTIIGTLRLSSQGQLIIFCRGICTITGTVDVSGRGGNGATEGNADAQGGFNYLGGNGGGGFLTGTPGAATRWNAAAAVGSNGASTAIPPEQVYSLLNFWNEQFRGGSGGGSDNPGANSAGGNGGGIVIIVSNFFFHTGIINARGRENLQGEPDIDLQDAGVGGGGIIITAARSTVANSGQRLVNGPIPPAPNNGNSDTNLGGNGWGIHLSLAP